ncbi:unnamed protein product [Prunus armeniaca]|uniref:Uncharacterized protein n=1 Tax=Prunus armeniaca TaxID=36596 RepID=A0A6J5WI25_PRUAR|nr:unnamed protein product [Prunus armeniaca]CAB4299014.1 unnamed protein product [Prunus armeniaca]
MMSFKRKEPPNDYLLLARRAIIACAQYLPLALSMLARPFEEIQNILRTSYGGLTNRAQQVFLDIAFFFKGKDMDYVIQVLKCHKLESPENCVQELVENACRVKLKIQTRNVTSPDYAKFKDMTPTNLIHITDTTNKLLHYWETPQDLVNITTCNMTSYRIG